MANIKITDLHNLIVIEELDDESSVAVVGGLKLEPPLEPLNPKTEIGKSLLGVLQSLSKVA